VDWFDAASVISARSWYEPSGSERVSQSVEYTPATPVVSGAPIVVHVVPSGEYWNSTDAMPAPLSLGVAVRCFVPAM
jgi:hypothetical protein